MGHSSSTLDTQQKKNLQRVTPPPVLFGTSHFGDGRQCLHPPTGRCWCVTQVSTMESRSEKKNDSANPHTFGCRLLTEIHLRPSVLATEHHDRIAEPSSCCPQQKINSNPFLFIEKASASSSRKRLFFWPAVSTRSQLSSRTVIIQRGVRTPSGTVSNRSNYVITASPFEGCPFSARRSNRRLGSN